MLKRFSVTARSWKVRAAAVLGMTALSAGCVNVVSGTVQLVQTPPVRGIDQILLTTDEVASAIGTDLEPNGPPAVGGTDKLDSGLRDDRDAAPIECIGAVQPSERVAYGDAMIRAVAVQEYWNHRSGQGGVLAVRTAAIELASPTAARKLFERSALQWKRCSEQTVTITKEDRVHVMWSVRVGEVSESDRLLTATNIWGDEQPHKDFPAGRALGVASNVIVDVDVDMDRDHGPPSPVGDRATRIADAMLRKVAEIG